ncbi:MULTISPECIES: glycosyltransferase family 39 protein [Anaeromyxobacter]|uniref:glycosyltransferase family 39 protein n=1 Tax=Anaeromyxobacter TaxID=161492 RepID=UPI001F5A2A9C|nr:MULTISPECIES: hypothetical protein [unclassified Anaeromyxobacter]
MSPARRLARPGPRAGAVLAAVATAAVLGLLAGAPGISRDEARVLGAAERVAGAAPLPRAEATSPPLAREAAGLAHGLFSRLGASHLRAFRLGTVAFAAVLSALLALAGHALAGASGAVLAPLLFWLAPRHLHAGLVATPDLAAAALWLATAWAYRRADRAAGSAERRGAAAAAGILFGAALTARTDAWILLAALALHAIAAPRVTPRPGAPVALDASPPRRGGPLAIAAMVLLGPAILVLSWPWLRADLHGRLAAAFAPGGGWHLAGAPAAGLHALLVTALTVPAAILWVFAGGALHATAQAVRGGVPDARGGGSAARDALLLVLCAVAPFAAAAAGLAPGAPGVRPFLPAMPFLALLGARALVAVAASAWPSRRAPLLAALSVLVLWPALRQAVHAFPSGASAWNELAGGAPGAASRGLRRQDGGEAAASVLEPLNARARPGARVWWPSTAPEAVEAWVRDGRLRPDLRRADGPEDADVAVVALDGASRDDEYRAWAAFRTARPAAGAYLDEVPLALVYARSGAWQ